jgi:hypothetical protein
MKPIVFGIGSVTHRFRLVERDAVGRRAEVGSVLLAGAERAVGANREARHAKRARLRDVDESLRGVERDAVREPEILGDDLAPSVLDAEEEAVAGGLVDRGHEVGARRAVRDPEAVLPIEEREVR